MKAKELMLSLQESYGDDPEWVELREAIARKQEENFTPNPEIPDALLKSWKALKDI